MGFFFAISAAISIGECNGSTWAHSSGNLTRINRTMAGHAELIIGFGIFPSDMIFLVASDTSSAAFETSKTSSNPKRFKAVNIKSI